MTRRCSLVQEILEARQNMQDTMEATKKEMEAAQKEESEAKDSLESAERGRGWQSLEAITSMEGEDEKDTLAAMKKDTGFVDFCTSNGLEIQEDVGDGDVQMEMGGAKVEEEKPNGSRKGQER